MVCKGAVLLGAEEADYLAHVEHTALLDHELVAFLESVGF